MLVRSEGEWRQRRIDLYKRSRMESIIIVAVVLWPIPILFGLTLSGWLGHTELVLIVATVLWIILVVGFSYYVHRDFLIDNVDLPADGLYENGAQGWTLFIPYTEIASIEIKAGLTRRETVILHSRYERRDVNSKVIKQPWSLSGSFLGVDGIEVLERRVHAQGSPS